MLITTLEQFIASVPTAAGMKNYTDVEPYLNSAELWLQNNILGETLYERICDEIDPSSGGYTIDAVLLRLCSNIIANHAYWDAIPFLDLVHTESGFGVIMTNNRAPASKERIERLRLQCIARRDAEIDNLIAWLEAHESFWDDWKGSPTYTVLTDCLISTATELKRYARWNGTRDEFLTMRPMLVHLTMMYIEPVIGNDYLDELIEKQADSDLTTADQKVITMLRYALGSMIDGNIMVAEKVFQDILRYMTKNIDDFPTYEDSAEYAARSATGYENSTDAPIFSSIM